MRPSALRAPAAGRALQTASEGKRSVPAGTHLSTIASRFAPEPDAYEDDEADLRAEPVAGLVSERTYPRSRAALIAAAVAGAVVPTAILAVLLWQGVIGLPRGDAAPTASSGQEAADQGPAASTPALEIVLTSPHQIEATAGEEVDFPIAVDSTDALPPRSLIAISAMPDGASFSEGRPYGTTGWSLRPDEIGELRLRLPAGRSGASDLRVEFLAADGTVLAQSETRLIVADAAVASAEAVGGDGAVAQPEAQPATAAPMASAEPSAPVATPAEVAAANPPAQTARVPHDGAMALGGGQEEWVEVVSAVDVHASALQSSETVRVVAKGLKLRVAGRDKNWVQVNDPATSESGWIYNRFLKPTEPPAQ